MTAETKAPLPECIYSGVDLARPGGDKTVRVVTMTLDKYEELRARIAALEADNKRLRDALNGALGYMRNARIDLETGAPKRTAINTISGGIKLVESALAQTDGKAGE